MKAFRYEGRQTREISFPLGGIGTGCIGLAGNGRLIDWEIAGRPSKNSANGFTHFAIKAERAGRVVDARVISGDLQAPYTGSGARGYSGFGYGPDRQTMAGMPHFSRSAFVGEFPLARLEFADPRFPGLVRLEAFNPFIPLNDADSSIPAALFEFEVENNTDAELTYTVCMSVNNLLPAGASLNSHVLLAGNHAMAFTSDRYAADAPEYGDLTFGTDAQDVSYQEYWFRGAWFDNLGIYWRDLTTPGGFRNRSFPAAPFDPSSAVTSGADVATLAGRLVVQAGQSQRIRFVLAWSFPNATNYWNPEALAECSCAGGSCAPQGPRTWRNYYATRFASSKASAEYCLANWDRLHRETKLFKEALFGSSLPEAVLDAVSANISILKSPTCLRLEDGSFYGWEGCACECGCCEGSCTHVWNYAYALPFLFPKLERSMRELDYRYNQRDDGGMCFRLQLPVGRAPGWAMPCGDGHFGGVVKAYRDWKISGDTEWLKSIWGAVKKSVGFAWAETNECKWDPTKSGVLSGRQHHTLDMELFGPNSWLTGFYLAALKAGAEMAEHLGEADTASEWRAIFERGKAWADTNLFNGSYYHQLVNIRDRSVLEPFGVEGAYWNAEDGELKYQIADGCGIDQVLAQWHANLCGLGEVLDQGQVRTALASIHANNFKRPIGDFANACRLYSLNDEAGLVICDWPEGTYKPRVPLTYAEETMNGFEYQAACHMIQEGLVSQGIEAVEAIRQRYDGERRNPWNEFECGSNYARSMASYALLLAFSGFEYDLTKGMLGFSPMGGGDTSFFWSVDCAWGTFRNLPGRGVELRVLRGTLTLRSLRLPYINELSTASVTLDGSAVACLGGEGGISLRGGVAVTEGAVLAVSL